MEHCISSFSSSFKPLSVELILSEMNENFQLISMDIQSVAIKLHKLITLMELEIMPFFVFKRQTALKFGYLFQST